MHSTEDLSHLGIKPVSPALQVDSLPAELPGKPIGIQVLMVFLLGEYHGQRSLVGLSPQGSTESNTSEET